MPSLSVDERFCGPPGAANGGYLSGRLAAFVEGPAEVTLRRPVPLSRTLEVVLREGGALLRNGESIYAEAVPVDVAIEVPPAPTLAAARSASRRFPRFVDHPLPACFVCGTGRAEGDGLRIFPGPLADSDVVAAPWRPDPSLAGEDRFVRPEFLWAALDCTGAFAVNEPPRGLVLLGRLAGRVEGRLRTGEESIVVGWPIADQGRKCLAGTALFTADGRLVAAARATWVFVRGPV